MYSAFESLNFVCFAGGSRSADLVHALEEYQANILWMEKKL
jgi:hypothetical protein